MNHMTNERSKNLLIYSFPNPMIQKIQTQAFWVIFQCSNKFQIIKNIPIRGPF